jgi:phenylpropionate dioxygenase-like ring-hydroxylating dioxygenase large terminal subunit
MRSIKEPTDIFDPRHYAAVRRPLDQAEPLPPWCYTSQAFFERERDQIFFKCWNCVGPASRVGATAGSYITLNYVDVPIVIVRGQDLTLRAFVNSCRHRGQEVVQGSGECKFLKCPYHAWAYSLEGDLVGTPLFEGHDQFDKADYGLVSLKLELWAGAMWINFDPDSSDLLSYLGDLPERTKAWHAEDMVCVSRVETLIEANWKQYYENFSDVYHVPFVHTSSLPFKGQAKREWHNPKYVGNYIMHRVWFPGTRSIPEDAKPLPEIDLTPDQQGAFYPWIYPNAGMSFTNDSVWLIELYPQGPEQTIHIRTLMVPKASAALPDFDTIIAPYEHTLATITAQDLTVLESQQRSAHSPVYKMGCFARMDELVHDSELWILDRVIGNTSADGK